MQHPRPRSSYLALALVLGCAPDATPAETDGEGSTTTPTTESPTTESPTTGASTGAPSCASQAPDFATPASSTRDGATVTTVGPGPRFTVPEQWLMWYADFGDNLHVSRAELETVREGAGEWDTEYAYVLNTLFDFDRCAATSGAKAGVRRR